MDSRSNKEKGRQRRKRNTNGEKGGKYGGSRSDDKERR